MARDTTAGGVGPFTGLAHYSVKTVAFWVYPDSLANPGVVFGHSQVSAPLTKGTVVTLNSFGPRVEFVSGRSGLRGVWSAPTPATGAWHHIAVTYDGGSTANDPLIYVDGVSQTVTEVLTPSGAEDTTAYNLYLGEIDGATNQHPGRVAEVALWNAILSAEEIAALAAGITVRRIRTADLKFHAPLHGAASPEPDLAGTGLTGAIGSSTAIDHAPVGAPYGFAYWIAPLRVRLGAFAFFNSPVRM